MDENFITGYKEFFAGSKTKFQTGKHLYQLSVCCREDYGQSYFYSEKVF